MKIKVQTDQNGIVQGYFWNHHDLDLVEVEVSDNFKEELEGSEDSYKLVNGKLEKIGNELTDTERIKQLQETLKECQSELLKLTEDK